MGWIALLLTVAGIALVAFCTARFPRTIAREAADLPRAQHPAPLDRTRLSTVPAPVERYLTVALGARVSPISSVRLTHGGRFRTALDAAFRPIRGEQWFVADPPGFVWWGHVGVMPGLWFDARDRSREGAGGMRVTIDSTVTLFDRAGPELDQGALLRLLCEMVWLPTAFLDARHVAWEAVDDRHARARLRVNGRDVTADFAFAGDGLPTEVHALRYLDDGKRSVLTPWRGAMTDFRRVDGVLVPFRIAAFWTAGGREVPYADFEVTSLSFE